MVLISCNDISLCTENCDMNDHSLEKQEVKYYSTSVILIIFFDVIL